MPYDAPSDADFKAISAGAKKSPAFRKMTGGADSEAAEGGIDPAEEGGEEASALGDAFDASQKQDRDTFVASMSAAIRACIDAYGAKAK